MVATATLIGDTARDVFRLGYNTNGLAHHRPTDAVRLIGELGYEGVALTPDVGLLDPLHPDPVTVDEIRRTAEEMDLLLTVETGARYVLDAKRKHYPSLLEDFGVERARRLDMLRRTVDLAADLGARVVSFWAGVPPGGGAGDADAPPRRADVFWDRLVEGTAALLDHARGAAVRVAFEPEPGMFVERPRGYDELRRRLGEAGAELGLCLDVGHLLCTGDLPVADAIRAAGSSIAQVHLDDIANGVHEHCMFGQGDLDLPSALAALDEVGFAGLAAVELSRDSHRGPRAAEEALGHLRRALETSA